MIWGAMSSAVFFLKTNVTAPVYQDILEHFMLPFADQLFKDADFIFQQDLAPAHTAKSTKSWLNDHGVGVLDWPDNSPNLNPIEYIWLRGKWETRDQKMQMSWRPFSKKPGLPYHLSSTYTVNEHTFQKANNSLKMFLFLLVLWSILICWDSELMGFC